MKIPFRLNTLTLALGMASMALPALSGSAAVSFSNQPLAAVGAHFGPNLVLGLSVEYPTAGPAYTLETTFTANSMTSPHFGYFDPYRCYVYQAPNDPDGSKAYENLYFRYKDYGALKQPVSQFWTKNPLSGANRSFPWTPFATRQANNTSGGTVDQSQYFEAVGWAQIQNGKITCNNNGAKDQFSGNLLNWATASAIDVFRKAMTGGNRALGPGVVQDFNSNQVGSGPADYSAGDTATATYLRRANVVGTLNGDFYNGRTISLSDADLKAVLPAAYSLNDPKNWFLMNASEKDYRGRNNVRSTAPAHADSLNDTAKIYVTNSGFGVDFRAQARSRLLSRYNAPYLYYAPSTFHLFPYTLSIKVCDNPVFIQNTSDAAGNPPPDTPAITANYDQCKLYPNGTMKPVGQIQENATAARFAAIGYLNQAGNNINGGVLRARMKFVVNPTPGTPQTVTTSDGKTVTLGDEIDPQSGVFVQNPDKDDANATAASFNASIPNSGLMNYLNKFGDAAGYKTNDPVAELFYLGYRYLAHGGAIYKPAAMSATMLDGFPAIYNWEDPLTSANTPTKPREAICRKNTMVIIGDSNTHQDHALPNFLPGGEGNPTGTDPNPQDSIIHTRDNLISILQNEGVSNPTDSNTWNANTGAKDGGSPRGMAGVAYGAHVKDIRPDLNKSAPINLDTFMIDVVEAGNFKDRFTNSFYLAAKYGGFDTKVGALPPAKNDPSWAQPRPTNPAELGSYDAALKAFPDGVPLNYAPANNPGAMVAAIQKLFSAIHAPGQPTQAGVASTAGNEDPVPTGKGAAMYVKGVYYSTDWSGDLIAQTNTSGGNTSSASDFHQVWSANELMTKAFHSTSGFSARQIYSRPNATTPALRFDGTAAATFQNALGQASVSAAQNLINYILGDPGNETTGLFRKRTNLMGTVVHSTPLAITAPKTKPTACHFANWKYVEKRPTLFSVAANDGMLHFFDSNGNEKAAYLPSTSLPLLNSYAKTGYPHAFLNDGSPVMKNLCFGATAKTLLVGTTGQGASGLNATAAKTSSGAIYAVDATDPNALGAGSFLWEFTSQDDADLGINLGKPILTQDQSGHPIVLISSGYNAISGSNKGYLFVLYADKDPGEAWRLGGNYFKIELGSRDVAPAAAFSSTAAGLIDRVYVGDDSGALWRVDIGKDGQWRNGQVPFRNKEGKALPLLQTKPAAPISAAPMVRDLGGTVYVSFGTGRLFDNGDMPSANRSMNNYAYTLFDRGRGPIDDNPNVLVEQTITGTVQAKNSQLYYLTGSTPVPGGKSGWKATLPPNAMILSSPVSDPAKNVYFPVQEPVSAYANSTSCKPNEVGNSALLPMKMTTGAAPDGHFWQLVGVDLKKSSQLTSLGQFVRVNKLDPTGLNMVCTVHKVSKSQCRSGFALMCAGESQQNQNCMQPAIPVFHRISWREIVG